MTVSPVPEGLPTLIPHLGVKGAAEAIDFYARAFGAREILARIADGQGRVGHAELQIGRSVFYLADEHPEIDKFGPPSLGGSPVSFLLHVDDVDTLVQQAVSAGAELTQPVADQFYGDRTGQVKDPYGYSWTLSTHVEDVSEEEMQRRAAELYGKQD